MEKLIIEWKHLAVEGETCDRCHDTGENLIQEIKRLNRDLNSSGYEVNLLETILSEDEISNSNSILLNGVPIEEVIELKVSENYCASCSDLVGSQTYCRTISYDGNAYDDIPAKAIREAVYKMLGLKQSEPAFKMVPANSDGNRCC